jgi:hypothetical protein
MTEQLIPHQDHSIWAFGFPSVPILLERDLTIVGEMDFVACNLQQLDDESL